MTTYGISNYGPPRLYGLDRPATVVPGGPSIPLISNAYLIDPFVATPVDYQSMLLTWNGPDPSTATPMNEFRLLSSRFGFPVDENDGNVLIDTTSAPGRSYLDQNVVPGEITYYAFYILADAGQWIRSGFTAALMPVNHGYAGRLFAWLPEYIRDITNGELTANAAGDTYLSQYLAVAGWSLDYLKTQYDLLFNTQNNPMKMSFADLDQLAGQIGMPFSGEIPAQFVRKAAANWAVVMRERGSISGVSEHISLLSGFGADVQVSRNIMLENDQSLPLDPGFAPWSAGIPYQVGEIVSWPVYPQWIVSQTYVVNNFVVYNGVNYQCTATAGTGVPPAGATTSATYWTVASGPFFYKCKAAITSLPGAAPPAQPAAGTPPTASNTNWQLVFDLDATTSYLAIPGLAGGVSTWEVLSAASGSKTPNTAAVAANSLTEGIGTHNPLNFPNDYSQNTLRVYNRSGGTEDTWLRSVSRQAADITAAKAVPDPQLVVEHGIPVPQTSAATSEWDAQARYATGDVVLLNGINYLALRASTGAQPAGTATPEWTPLGTDARIPLTVSAEAAQNFSQASGTPNYAIFPFVEWYDNWGYLIDRVFARTAVPGTSGVPGSYTYDSFTASPGASLNGRETDTQDQAWDVVAGSFLLDGNGNAYAGVSGSPCVSLVQAPGSATQGVTFTEAPPAGTDLGLVFWYQNATAYWHAGMTGLWYNNSGTWTEAATYPVAFEPGDRIYVDTNRAAASVTVYRNGFGAFNSATGRGQVAQLLTLVPPVAAATKTTTGGTIHAGTYQVEVTWVTASGETTPGPSFSIITTGTTSTITVTSPPATTGATGWYAYVTQLGGTTFTRQQASGSPTAIGTNLTLTAPPTSSGAAPPTSNTSGLGIPAAMVPGASTTVFSGIASEVV